MVSRRKLRRVTFSSTFGKVCKELALIVYMLDKIPQWSHLVLGLPSWEISKFLIHSLYLLLVYSDFLSLLGSFLVMCVFFRNLSISSSLPKWLAYTCLEYSLYPFNFYKVSDNVPSFISNFYWLAFSLFFPLVSPSELVGNVGGTGIWICLTASLEPFLLHFIIYLYKLKTVLKPSIVDHACNPSYSGSGYRRILFWGQPRKKLVRPYLKNKLGIVANACDPSYLGGWSRRMEDWGQPWGKVNIALSEKQSESKRSGLSLNGRVLSQQAWGPEFTPQYQTHTYKKRMCNLPSWYNKSAKIY
jgi:hypothetical protein